MDPFDFGVLLEALADAEIPGWLREAAADPDRAVARITTMAPGQIWTTLANQDIPPEHRLLVLRAVQLAGGVDWLRNGLSQDQLEQRLVDLLRATSSPMVCYTISELLANQCTATPNRTLACWANPHRCTGYDSTHPVYCTRIPADELRRRADEIPMVRRRVCRYAADEQTVMSAMLGGPWSPPNLTTALRIEEAGLLPPDAPDIFDESLLARIQEIDDAVRGPGLVGPADVANVIHLVRACSVVSRRGGRPTSNRWANHLLHGCTDVYPSVGLRLDVGNPVRPGDLVGAVALVAAHLGLPSMLPRLAPWALAPGALPPVWLWVAHLTPAALVFLCNRPTQEQQAAGALDTAEALANTDPQLETVDGKTVAGARLPPIPDELGDTDADLLDLLVDHCSQREAAATPGFDRAVAHWVAGGALSERRFDLLAGTVTLSRWLPSNNQACLAANLALANRLAMVDGAWTLDGQPAGDELAQDLHQTILQYDRVGILLLSLVAGVGPVADLAGEALAVRVVVDCMVPSLANPLEAGLARARLAWLASPVAGLVPGVDPDTLAAHIRRTYQPARNIYNGLNGVISPDAILLGGMLSGGPVVQAAVVMVVSACGPGLRLADWIRAA